MSGEGDDGRLDAHIARVEHREPACRDCEVGEPHMCHNLPPESPAPVDPVGAGQGQEGLTSDERDRVVAALWRYDNFAAHGIADDAMEVFERILADRLAARTAGERGLRGRCIEWRVETDTTEDEFGTDEQGARDWFARCKANPDWEPPALMRRTVVTESSEWVEVAR